MENLQTFAVMISNKRSLDMTDRQKDVVNSIICTLTSFTCPLPTVSNIQSKLICPFLAFKRNLASKGQFCDGNKQKAFSIKLSFCKQQRQ